MPPSLISTTPLHVFATTVPAFACLARAQLHSSRDPVGANRPGSATCARYSGMLSAPASIAAIALPTPKHHGMPCPQKPPTTQTRLPPTATSLAPVLPSSPLPFWIGAEVGGAAGKILGRVALRGPAIGSPSHGNPRTPSQLVWIWEVKGEAAGMSPKNN